MCGFLTLGRFCTPNPWADPGSTVYTKREMSFKELVHRILDAVQSLSPVWLCDPMSCSMSRLPCPSLSPGVCSNSCSSSQWCHPTITLSVVRFFSCPQSLPALESSPRSWLVSSSGQSIGASASASALPMNIQDWFPLGWTGLLSLQSKALSRVFSSTTLQKHQFFSIQPSLWSDSHICAWLLEKP